MQAISVAVSDVGQRRSSTLILALTVLALVGIGASAFAQPESVLLSVELPDRPTTGARLFAQKGCSRCHSLGGTEPRVGPDLGRILFSGSVLDLAGAFWNHSPVMREKMQDLKIPPPSMTTDEMANLVAFLSVYRYYLTEVGEPGNVTDGREVFVQKRCAECHDDDGESWDKLGPGLQRYRGRSSAIFLAEAMWNHGAEMASVMRAQGMAWPMFAGREMGDLVAYLQGGTGTGRGADNVYFEPGDPRRGQELFVAKECDTCHAIAGRGGQGGPDLGLLGRELITPVAEVAGLMWNHSQGMTAEFERRSIPRVTFSGQEMADIIAYLYFVNYANVRGTPSRGAEVFIDNCAVCHSVGSGRRTGPDLATAADLGEPLAIITAMWNHAAVMEQEIHRLGLAWPRLRPGEAADLLAFLLSRRTPPTNDE